MKSKSSKITTPAVVLFSGGMDSTTLLCCALADHVSVIAVSFDYNQRHKKEINSAAKIALRFGVEHIVIKLEMPRFSGSPLVDSKTNVPTQIENMQGLTVVPLRNSLFLLHACLLARAHGAEYVYIGAVAEDQKSYPDCRPEFFKAFQKMLESQGEVNIRVLYPFVSKTKKDIVTLGESLGVPWKDTWSCYIGGDSPCLDCDACMERRLAFNQAGIKDPLVNT